MTKATAPVRKIPQSPRLSLLAVIIALASGLLASAPLWGPGIINTRGGGDSPFLIQRTFEMAENLGHGIFPPRWMSHAAYDLGYPFFNHYAALPYYVSGGLTALGLNILSAIQFTQTLGFVLAALAMGLWVRKIYRHPAAQALSIIAYTFAPFHLVNVYVRGDSLSEFYAFVWYPLILWALDRLAERPSTNRVLTAALTYSGLILTHNVSAVIFSPFALIWGIFAIWRGRLTANVDRGNPSHPNVDAETHHPQIPLRQLATLLLPFVIGALLATWFWLPAIAETQYAQMGSEFTAGYFHYSNHFRDTDLVQPSPAFNYSVATNLESVSPFSMGLVQALLSLAGLGVLAMSIIRNLRGRRDAALDLTNIALVAGAGLATLMITPLSRPLWDYLPLLEITQFPWRFLSVQALFVAAVIGSLGDPSRWPAGSQHRGQQTTLVCVSLGLATFLIVSALSGLSPERLIIGPDDVTRDNLLLYESFTGNIGTTIRHEYLPKDVVPRLYISEAVVDGSGSLRTNAGQVLNAQLVEQQPNRQIWQVSLPEEAATVAFPLNWWPGWVASVDGTPTPGAPIAGSGRAALEIPVGQHTVEWKLESTTLQRNAAWLSVITAIVCLCAARWRLPRRSQRASLLRVAASIVIVIGVSSAGPLLLQRPPISNAPFFDFELMPYPHQGPVDFGVARLETASVSRQTAAPGDALDIALMWSGNPTLPLTATVEIVSPAVPRHNVDYSLAEVTLPVEEIMHAHIKLPDELARGLYLLRLSIHSFKGPTEPRTAQGNTMGDLYIGVLRVPTGSHLAADSNVLSEYTDLTLHALETAQTTPTDLSVTLKWSTQGTSRNWRLSLRLLDASGKQIAQQDHQPGYGYLPTTLWQPGELIVDTAHLPLPEGLAPGNYTLRVITYLQATGQGGGETDIPVQLTAPTLWDIRDACCEQTRKGATILCQTQEVALLSANLPETVTEGDDLTIEAEWNALLAPSEDVLAKWQVVAPDGAMLSAVEQAPAAGSQTSQWPRYTWVLAPVAVDLPNRLDAGTYSVELTLSGEAGGAKACGTVATFDIISRDRVFEVPHLPIVQEATFGDTIKLLGYDISGSKREEVLHVTLWWQAMASPTEDLKRFVHLYDPVSAVPLVQDDAMPRDWTYPTSWWVPGEIVSETIDLALDDVAEGSYRLGVGWYNPETLTRLQARTADGQSVGDDRVMLDQPVILQQGFRWLRR